MSTINAWDLIVGEVCDVIRARLKRAVIDQIQRELERHLETVLRYPTFRERFFALFDEIDKGINGTMAWEVNGETVEIAKPHHKAVSGRAIFFGLAALVYSVPAVMDALRAGTLDYDPNVLPTEADQARYEQGQ